MHQVITPFRKLMLCAENRKEMEDWISALKSVQKWETYEVRQTHTHKDTHTDTYTHGHTHGHIHTPQWILLLYSMCLSSLSKKNKTYSTLTIHIHITV